jgi:RimJ/RimL family protein N-acetyltransferase
VLYLRKAQIEDCRAVYDLRNDPEVRSFSFTGDSIPYDSHVKWFESSLTNSQRRIYIVEEDKVALGVVRFDLNEAFSQAVVSINISPKAWGRGLGSFALTEGERRLKEEYKSLEVLVARVMEQNTASKKLFQKCDYTQSMVEFTKEVK